MANQSTKQRIMDRLIDAFDWTTSGELAETLGISVRNVKYSVAELNEDHPGLITSSAKGYSINKAMAREIMGQVEGGAAPLNYAERKSILLTRLLAQGQKLTVDELAGQLCVAPETLQNELARIRAELNEYHLALHVRKDVVSITGLDKDKRSAVMHFVNDELQASRFSRDSIQQVFTTVDLKEVEGIVLEVLRKHEYFLDDYSLLNYCLHLGLTIEINGAAEEGADPYGITTPALEELGAPAVRAIVNDIYERLKEVYQTPYTLRDIYQASVLMMTRAVTTQVEVLRYEQLQDILGPEIKSLLDDIVSAVDRIYGIQTGKNEDFLIRFAFHLKNLLVRLKNGIRISNLQFSEIKDSYPFMYAIAVSISNIIHEKTDLWLPEDEIAYIALHIGVLMQEQIAIHNRVSCVLVCSDYNLLSQRIFKRISHVCTDNLLIANIYTSIDRTIDLSNVDLVVTTERLPSIGITQLVIDPFMSEADFRNLFSVIDSIKQEKISNRVREKILYFFHEDLFFVDAPLVDQNDAIEYICDRMTGQGYVGEDFKQKIYDHERIAASSYGRVAIAHPLDHRAGSSVIAVALNHTPIRWGDNRVKLTFVFTLREEDRDLFSDIFELITRNVSDDAEFDRLMGCATFDEFIDTLIGFSGAANL